MNYRYDCYYKIDLILCMLKQKVVLKKLADVLLSI